MAKVKNWKVLQPGTPVNPSPFFRVANHTDALRWWKGAKAYSFESYETPEQADARVAELIDAKARELDVARTLTWVNNATSSAAEYHFHRGQPVASVVKADLSHAAINLAIATRMSQS